MAASSGGLQTYILRRLLLMIPTMLGVTVIVFLLCLSVPGGPIDQYRLQLTGGGAGETQTAGGTSVQSDSNLTEEQLQVLREYYGFDKPIYVQYLIYMRNILTLDLGNSQRYTRPVIDLIKERIPISLYFGLITTILTYSICIPLGIVKAIKHRTAIDNSTSVLIFVGYAVPNFALGAVLLSILSVRFGWFPLGGFNTGGEEFANLSLIGKIKDQIHHTFLPLAAMSTGLFAVMTILMKNSLMENMSADFVKTGLAKGLDWKRVILFHAVRNSLIPLATSFGGNISLLIAGFLLIEVVFNIPGIGLLFFEGIQNRDYPLVMGLTLISAFLLLLGNLLSDMCVAFVDPRVRFS